MTETLLIPIETLRDAITGKEGEDSKIQPITRDQIQAGDTVINVFEDAHEAMILKIVALTGRRIRWALWQTLRWNPETRVGDLNPGRISLGETRIFTIDSLESDMLDYFGKEGQLSRIKKEQGSAGQLPQPFQLEMKDDPKEMKAQWLRLAASKELKTSQSFTVTVRLSDEVRTRITREKWNTLVHEVGLWIHSCCFWGTATNGSNGKIIGTFVEGYEDMIKRALSQIFERIKKNEPDIESIDIREGQEVFLE